MGAQRVISLNGVSGSGMPGKVQWKNHGMVRERRLVGLEYGKGHHMDIRAERRGEVTRARSKKRLIWWFAASWCVGALVFFSVLNGAANAESQTMSLRVQEGQTLWGIAETLAPGQDPRSTVQDIIRINHLGGSQSIYPGEILQVPRNQ